MNAGTSVGLAGLGRCAERATAGRLADECCLGCAIELGEAQRRFSDETERSGGRREKGGRDWRAEAIEKGRETLGQGAPYIFTSPNQARGHRPALTTASSVLLLRPPPPCPLRPLPPGHVLSASAPSGAQPRSLIPPIRPPDRSKSAAAADSPAAAANAIAASRPAVRTQKA